MLSSDPYTRTRPRFANRKLLQDLARRTVRRVHGGVQLVETTTSQAGRHTCRVLPTRTGPRTVGWRRGTAPDVLSTIEHRPVCSAAFRHCWSISHPELVLRLFFHRLAAYAAAALLLTAVGCAHHQTVASSATDAATLVFANESPAQVEVWAVAPDVNTRRIGTVMAGETSTIRVPDDFVSQGRVGFYAKVRGSTAMPITETYSFHQGEKLRVRLQRDARTLSRVL